MCSGAGQPALKFRTRARHVWILELTFDGFADIPRLDVTALCAVLVQQHKAERDVWLILDRSERQLRQLSREQGHQRMRHGKLVMVCNLVSASSTFPGIGIGP